MAELTIALSLATDLGTGQPLEHGLRTCLLSLAAAAQLRLDDDARSCVYYTALLRFLGCTSDAAETAALSGGDDVGYNATFAPVLLAEPGEGMRFFVRHLAEDLPWHRRAGRIVRALADKDGERRSLSQHCEAGSRLAGRLGIGADVCHALAHAYGPTLHRYAASAPERRVRCAIAIGNGRSLSRHPCGSNTGQERRATLVFTRYCV